MYSCLDNHVDIYFKLHDSVLVGKHFTLHYRVVYGHVTFESLRVVEMIPRGKECIYTFVFSKSTQIQPPIVPL